MARMSESQQKSPKGKPLTFRKWLKKAIIQTVDSFLPWGSDVFSVNGLTMHLLQIKKESAEATEDDVIKSKDKNEEKP
jgi:hypothetical protein